MRSRVIFIYSECFGVFVVFSFLRLCAVQDVFWLMIIFRMKVRKGDECFAWFFWVVGEINIFQMMGFLFLSDYYEKDFFFNI